MTNVFDLLKARGFIDQCTHEEQTRELLGRESVTFYVGFDPTADSLHVGHYLVAMAMSHMQRAGHTPIILVGGGTGMVGDPTARTDMRTMMTREQIDHNVECFKRQLSRFISVENGRAIVVNNADWLLELKYLPFIREYGVHFSVNKMLTADAYKTRFERGLSFFEFNYQLLQAYDFLELYRKHRCLLQMGGRDQWSNIIAGIELIRRVENKAAQGLTFTLLARSDNEKMGKSMGGAVWLDAKKTSPYDFYQYWRNTADADVISFMKLLTYLPLEEIAEFAALEGSGLNKAKEVLAFEVTKNVHGEAEAQAAQTAARALFAGGGIGGSVPTTRLDTADIPDGGITIIELLEKTKLCASRSEARRLIQQGGVKAGGKTVSSIDEMFTSENFAGDGLMLQKGKKVFHKIVT